MIIHLHLLSVQQNKTSFEKLIQSIREREAEKKFSVKQNLVISDEENDFKDSTKDAHVQNVVRQRTIMKNRIIISDDDDDDAMEKEYDLNDPSGSRSPKNETASETTFDVNYEGDTDDTVSPVLGGHTANDCSRKEHEKCYEREPPQNLTPDMFEKSLSISSSKKCSSSVPQMREVDRDEDSDAGSSQSFSLLAEQTQGNKFQCNPFIDCIEHCKIRLT
jgi:hypothetical protein